uniref:Family with sequence similarity 210 member B n=1 Tax=Hucho hucho TaxID=62062 RepID=A0A4W5N2M3_9TELE
MFVCRGARLWAKALEQGLNSTTRAAEQLQTNRLKFVDITCTWPARNIHAFKCSRAFGGYIAGDGREKDDPARSPDGKRDKRDKDMFSVNNPDSVRFIITHQQQLTRVNSFSLNLSSKSFFSRNVTRNGTSSTLYRTNEGQSWQKKLYVDALQPVFTPGANVCSRRLYPTLTVQMRPFSSAAVAPKRVEDSPADHKVDQTPKQASAKGPEEPEVTEPEEDKPSKTQQLKKIFKEYGAVGVSFHICMSLMSLGMFYLAVSSGIDMAAILYKIGFSESLVQSKLAAGTSTFVLAYAIHKLFAPLRISITVISVPLLVRYLRKSGLFKTPNSPTH